MLRLSKSPPAFWEWHRRLIGCIFFLMMAGVCFPLHAESKLFRLDIQGGSLPQAERVMRVKKGDQITWKIKSDADGELHIHAYQIDLTIKAGVEKVYTFKAFATGRFRVEWHPESERGKGIHHQESLARLEVFPN